MKNPLRKRLLRELRQEMGKYLVVFILMVTTIGFVSGFLVADGSMLIAYNEGFEKYNIEDGNFRTAEQIHKTQRVLATLVTFLPAPARSLPVPSSIPTTTSTRTA